MHENWSEILDDINTVAPYEHQQQLIMAACESLNDRAYIHFLDKVGKLYAKGDINDAVLSVVLNTSEAREGFLALNYDDPSVQSFLKNVRSKMQTTNPASNYINGVLSGKGKKEVLESPDMPFLTVKQKELLQLLIIAGSVVVVVVTALAARYFIIRSRRKI